MAANGGVLEFVREDDFVEYYLFPQGDPKESRDEELTVNSALREARNVTKKHAGRYLWHRDEFALCARTSKVAILTQETENETLPAHLYGITHYGDNIEDEWFVVHLLAELTRRIDGSIARVVDADGEFLLIEAADALPAWMKPENCDKRVYIYKGLVHVVAPEVAEDDATEPRDITVEEALKTIRSNPSLTVAAPEIQEAVRRKIAGYPERIVENLHRTKAYLPVAVAAILETRPDLIAPAVRAFCDRDTLDVAACRAMKYFPPEDRVYASVTFTKCLYAMLTHSKYVPDRKTGWNLPAQSSPQYRAANLGVRIACGFEILASRAKPAGDLEADKGWHTYLNSLKAKGYFRNLLEHSQEHNNLLNRAKEYYADNRASMRCAPTVGRQILELSRNLDYSAEELRRKESDLPSDDPEDWLDVSPEELDRMLRERYGRKPQRTSDAGDFARKLTSFLEHVSDVDGAEFPDEPTAPPRKPREAPKVNFDADSFSSAVQNILNFAIPEDDGWDLDSDSDMDDYGREEDVPTDYGELRTKMEEYVKRMDGELAATTIGESFERRPPTDGFDDVEAFRPVDIDVNALKNMLESYRSQMGDAGPSGNMLGPMGVHLDDADSD